MREKFSVNPKSHIRQSGRNYLCCDKRPVDKFPFRTVMVLVECADGSNDDTCAEIQGSIEFIVEQCSFEVYLFGAMFEFKLRQKTDLARNSGIKENVEPSHFHGESFRHS